MPSQVRAAEVTRALVLGMQNALQELVFQRAVQLALAGPSKEILTMQWPAQQGHVQRLARVRAEGFKQQVRLRCERGNPPRPPPGGSSACQRPTATDLVPSGLLAAAQEPSHQKSTKWKG